MKILIVEDDLSLSDVIAFTLRRAGFVISTAYDGVAALAAWEAERPDLLVLDLNLPKVDGLEICRRIRLVDKTPIIMLSVRSGDEVVVKGLDAVAHVILRMVGYVMNFAPLGVFGALSAVILFSGPTLRYITLKSTSWAARPILKTALLFIRTVTPSAKQQLILRKLIGIDPRSLMRTICWLNYPLLVFEIDSPAPKSET